MKRLLKYISFGLLGVILPILMLATVIEKFQIALGSTPSIVISNTSYSFSFVTVPSSL